MKPLHEHSSDHKKPTEYSVYLLLLLAPGIHRALLHLHLHLHLHSRFSLHLLHLASPFLRVAETRKCGRWLMTR